VLKNTQNIGKGASLIKGFDYAISKGYDAVLTMDGDGQHLPEDIPAFLAAANTPAGYGIIIGNRMSRVENMPLIRIITNMFMSWLISGIAHQKSLTASVASVLSARMSWRKSSFIRAILKWNQKYLLRQAEKDFP